VGVLLLSLLLLPALLLAGTTGKIKGKVTDRENGEPLPGANIVVEGTSLGAAADLNGEFVILSVPVGSYSLKCSFIGYRTVTVSNVRVNVDLTTEQNFSMPSEAVELSAVEVVAERPLVNKNATNEVHIRSAEEIKALPIRGFANVVGIQAGVVQVGGTLYVRGGRAEEITYYVDGVYQNNAYDLGRAGDLSNNSLEEVQYQAGGFNAEYGFANSGLVHATTKSGGSRMTFSGEVITDEYLSKAEKNLGTYSYGYNLYNLAVSGPLPVFDDKVKFYIAGEHRFLRDRNPSQPFVGLRLDGQGRVLDINGNPVTDNSTQLYQYFEQGIKPNNATRDWYWNGNVTVNLEPMLVKIGGNSTRYTRNEYNHVDSQFNGSHNALRKGFTDSYYVKFTHTLGPKTFYDATLSYFRDGSDVGDPVWFDDVENYGDKTDFNNDGRYNPQLPQNGTNTPRDRAYTFDLFEVDGNITNGYSRLNSTFYGAKADLTHQAGRNHELKGGFEYRYNTIRFYNIGPVRLAQVLQTFPVREEAYQAAYANNIGYTLDGQDFLDSGRDQAKDPIIAAAYLQDKIELQDLVLNIGLRWDRISARTPGFRDPTNIVIGDDGQIANQVYKDANGNYTSPNPTAQDKVGTAQLVEGAASDQFSPRLGISFPVTDNTVFHAQYGKFLQQPELNRLFISYVVFANNLTGGNFTTSGNPNLKPIRTTSYEVGFRQQIGENAALDITAYYKEIRDHVQLATIYGRPSPYAAYQNGDYGTVKGLSFSFDLRRTNRVAVSANYTLQYASGTGSGANTNFNIAWQQGNFPTFVSPLDYDQRHTGTLNFDFRTNADDGPKFLGGRILGRLGLNALLTFGSGRSYTPVRARSFVFPGTAGDIPTASVNSASMPGTYQLDMKLDKTFTLPGVSGVTLNAYVWAINVTNAKNVADIYPSTGEADNDGWLDTPAGKKWIETFGPNAEAIYKLALNDPTNYGPPRQIRLGLRLDWY
jgi:outer membrane receptor protein involved in Fe transport